MKDNISMTAQELRSVLILSLIFAFRMSGIFMILPVLMIYALSLQGSDEFLVGIAIGIYGIMQIIFQIPFGFMSDKIGRKPVIIGGLIISALGTEMVALTNSIWGLILGRTLQGSAAIGSCLITLLLDSVRERYQTQAMAIIGATFGITFTGSIILGPVIANNFGLHGLFHIITILTIFSVILVYFMMPSVFYNNDNSDYKLGFSSVWNNIKMIVTRLSLLKFNFNIFCVHTILILNFVAWPKVMVDLGFNSSIHFKIYAAIIFISIVITFPCIYYFNMKNNKKKMLSVFINILFLSELVMFMMTHNQWIFLFGIQLFFIIFNLLEAILPTLIRRQSPSSYHGTTISIYFIGQFLGTGLGGILGGFFLKTQGIQSVFFFALIIAVLNIIVSNFLYKKN